jgi:hypothetical protein
MLHRNLQTNFFPDFAGAGLLTSLATFDNTARQAPEAEARLMRTTNDKQPTG